MGARAEKNTERAKKSKGDYIGMNLHLMSVYTHFNSDMIQVLNHHFPQNMNLFVLRYPFPGMKEHNNCLADPSRFSVSYINSHAAEYNHIFLHFNYLKPYEIMRLSDEAASKIVWIVWGDDLYYVKYRYEASNSPREFVRNTLYTWSHYSLLFGIIRRKAKLKIQKFHSIGIGYPYDEVEIRKNYGEKVPVVYAPVFSENYSDKTYSELRQKHLNKKSTEINVLVGHSGFAFHDHEKSLRILSKFRDENIHINMVLSYGASETRIDKLTKMAVKYFGKEKVTILTDFMPYKDYCDFLASMDIALFPFAHQAALGNVNKLAYAGVKLYLDPEGALAKGFHAGGVETSDYNRIRNQNWADFCAPPAPINTEAPLFKTYSFQKSLNAWADLLD